MKVIELPGDVGLPGEVAGNGEGMHEGGRKGAVQQVGVPPITIVPLGAVLCSLISPVFALTPVTGNKTRWPNGM
jgi:hypothetical protein